MISRFTDPFRYAPHPLVRSAAEFVMSDLDERIRNGKLPEEVCKGFLEGKMLGVLVCESEGLEEPVYVAGFSGSVGNRSVVEGFVPPIYDLLDPDGYFKEKEADISAINKEIYDLLSSERYLALKAELAEAERRYDSETQAFRDRMTASKQDRARRRAEGCDPNQLIRESQFEKAEFRRIKTLLNNDIELFKESIASITSRVNDLKISRAQMSDKLQEWIFKQYRVHNALGEESSIYDIFSSQGLLPPGGTGDCAAPKLLEHAYRHGLKPLAMGEFWYGTSPDTAVRTHGHFYPSCTSKCGPLLGFMMKGLELEKECPAMIDPVIVHEDDCLVAVSKPSGMPSVPGLDGRISVQEWLEQHYGCCGEDSACEVHAVHRLDMDTSGVLLFAKNSEAAVCLRKQFEEHTIRKTYMARLCPIDSRHADASSEESQSLDTLAATGRIELPLSPDYDERPRQKVDKRQGKEAITEYEISSFNQDGTIDIIFHPVTGRTHQLRVHSAHHLGLGRPILGDMLYGGQSKAAPETPERLHLHARSITFNHPATLEQITAESFTFAFDKIS